MNWEIKQENVKGDLFDYTERKKERLKEICKKSF